MTQKDENAMDGKTIRAGLKSENKFVILKKFVQAYNKHKADSNEADEYLNAHGNLQEIIAILKDTDKKNLDDITLVFSAMQILIVKIAAKYPDQLNSTEQTCRFFFKEHISLVHSMLSSNSNAKQRRVVLKLLSSIVCLPSSLSREILNHLSLHSAMVSTLAKQTNPEDPDSVRTNFIHFVLSFLLQDNLQLTKAFLEKHAALSSIFAELIYDSHELVHMVLSTVKQYVLQKQGISKTLKLYIFNSRVIESLINLYNWKGPDHCPHVKGKKNSGVVAPEEKKIVVETLHDFLLTLLTLKKYGIIFQDSVSDSSSSQGNNQIVNAVLKKLECPWEHEKPAELIVEILKVCPGLVKSQFSHVEPYLEPRISKKWISAMRYVEKIIESINLNNVLEETSPQISAYQLSTIFLNASLPTKIINSAILTSVENKHMVCRYEGLKLLRTMLQKISTVLEIVKTNKCNSEAFEKNIKNYITQNIPDPDTFLKIWNLTEITEEETSCTEISIPSKLQYLDLIMELFLLYREITGDIIFVDDDFDPANLLNNLDELQNENAKDINILKIKVIRFLLSVDYTIFELTTKTFIDTFTLLVSNKGTKDIQCTLLSKFFDKYSDEIEIWIEGISRIENVDEKIEVANWFAKTIKSTVEKNEKYSEMIYANDEAEEERWEGKTNGEKIKYFLEHFFINNKTKLQDFSSVSPILCCIVDKMKKRPKPNILNFLKQNMIDIFHAQVSPIIFINVINGFDGCPLLNYFNSWSNKSSTDVESIAKNSDDCLLMQNLLNKNDIDVKALVKMTSSYEIVNQLRLAVFCLTQLSDQEILNETIISNCKKVILYLTEKSKMYPSCFENCCKWIFCHPIMLNNFKPVFKKKQQHQNMLISTLSEIAKVVKSQNENTFPNVDQISLYQNKLGEQLKMIFDKERTKPKNILIELVDVFGLNFNDATELLNKIVKFEMESLDKEVKLTDFKRLIPKLFRICFEEKNEEKLFESGELVLQFMQIYIGLKKEKVLDLVEWENCMLKYFEKFENQISSISNEMFSSLFQNNISSSLVQFLSFLISKKENLTQEFMKIVLNNSNVLKHAKVIFPIMSNNLNQKWDKKFLTKLYNTYQSKITKYLIKPEKNVYWIPENKDAVTKIIRENYEPTICTKICQTILYNGDKINVLNTQYLELLEVVFTKNINEICSTQNFLLVLVFIMANALKKEANDVEKLNFLCDVMRRTVAFLKSKKELYLDELNKSSSWSQFTRFSLKLGLKVSKNKESNRLMRMLSEVCDIAYKDNDMQEYVKTMFEMTTSHSEFLNIMLKHSDIQRDLLNFLWILIRKNNSVMLTNQVSLFLAAYNGTLSESDQFILMILHYYEKNKKIEKQYKPFLFGEAAATHYSVRDDKSTTLWRQPTSTQFFDLLNLELVNSTITNFPVNRGLNDTTLHTIIEVYDPAFYLSLFYTLLSEKNFVPYKKFIRCGGLALSLIALSSLNDQIRLLAYNVLQRYFYFHLTSASSKHDVLLWVQFLQALGNGIQEDSETKLKTIRLNGFVANFMAKVSLIANESPLYASVHAFFRAKPALNLNEIPELLNFFHSSDVEYRKHRIFILHVIRDGMKTENDTRVALKTSVFKLLFHFYFCQLAEREDQILILEILKATTELSKMCQLLVNDYALLPWLYECISKTDLKNEKPMKLLKNILSNISNAFNTKSDWSDFIEKLALKLNNNEMKVLKIQQ